MSYSGGVSDYGLSTIENGKVPTTRMKSARQVQDFALRLRQNDNKRSWKRSRVDGLVGGNPPYRNSKLRDAGMGNLCNVNWGTGRMYLESGSGAFYDLLTEAPGQVSIETSHGANEDERIYNSRTMSKEADLILQSDPLWDFEMQQSQDQATLHGRGPLLFEDAMSVLPKACHDGDLKVPERTKADTGYWEVAIIEFDYYPPDLYKFIEDEKAATAVGWDVAFTKDVIANAMDVRQPDNNLYDWEFYQREIKNNSLTYYDDSKVCHIVHVFWKEFDGRVTHAMVEREATTSNESKYLFIHVGRYASFRECIHPMYFDRGNGGFHHSVTGLGVKMFGAMEYENRLLCNLMDKAFAPKILFRPTSSEAKQKMELAHYGDYGVLPGGWEAQQVPIQGFLTDGLAMWRASSELMRSNLSNYRQQTPMREQGNPATAREVMMKASEQSALSKPTYARYYKQLDLLYSEIVRRLCILHSTDPRAKKFQERCLAQGVPKECFGRIQSVRAVRVIGQGNSTMRMEAVNALAQIVQRLPEDGQQHWLNDYISCNAGQSAVERYNPTRTASRLPSDQHFEASQSVGIMKVGVPPLVTSSQNPVVFAGTYLKAAVDALESLKQGGDMMEVFAFLQICGPAINAQLQRFASDPYRAGVYQVMFDQWKKLSQISDQLRQQIQSRMQAQQQQRGKTQQTLSDEQLKAAKTQNAMQIARAKLKMAQEKHQQSLARDAASTRQRLALDDARVASDIQRENRKAQFATPTEG